MTEPDRASFLEFPSQAEDAQDEDHSSAGVAAHQKKPRRYSLSSGVMALDFGVFDVDEWVRECMNLLIAHNWCCDEYRLSSEFAEMMKAQYGPEILDDFQRGHERTWRYEIWELAAVTFTPVLSRLWYACNMLGLYFLHDDAVRLGYFWCEYQHRLRHEKAALVGQLNLEARQRGGGIVAAQNENKRRPLLREMEALIEKGHSVRNAARLAAGKGIGVSTAANQKQWNRYGPMSRRPLKK